MRALNVILAGGIVAAAFVTAVPAAAQYYPGSGYGGIGGMINQVFGGGYGYGVNQQAVVNQCAAAVQQRLNGGYGGYGYTGSGYGGGRVLGISRVEPRSGGGLIVHGVATSGRNVAYGYAGDRPDLTWRCKADYRGFINDVDVNLAQGNYGYNYNYNYNYNYTQPYSPYDYSQYGYRRY
jgi:hypothetical protein